MAKVIRLSTFAKKNCQGDEIMFGNLKFRKERDGSSGNEFVDLNLGEKRIKEALLSDDSDNYIIWVGDGSGSYHTVSTYLVNKLESGHELGQLISGAYLNNSNLELCTSWWSDDDKSKWIDDSNFIVIRKNSERKSCILTTSFNVVGDRTRFGLIDNGFRIVRCGGKRYAFKYSRRYGNSYLYDTKGDLDIKIQLKIVYFFGQETDICVVKFSDNTYKLFSIRAERIISSEPIIIPPTGDSCPSRLPVYVNEYGKIEEGMTALFTIDGKLAVFDLEQHILVKYINPIAETFSWVAAIHDSTKYSFSSSRPTVSSRMWIIKREEDEKEKFNILCGNTLVSEEWWDSFKVYKGGEKPVDKRSDWLNASIVECFIEGDHDILEIKTSPDSKQLWRWRYDEFGRINNIDEDD